MAEENGSSNSNIGSQENISDDVINLEIEEVSESSKIPLVFYFVKNKPVTYLFLKS